MKNQQRSIEIDGQQGHLPLLPKCLRQHVAVVQVEQRAGGHGDLETPEVVQGQRPLAGIEFGHGLGQRLVAAHDQGRAENFVHGDLAVGAGVHHQAQGHAALRCALGAGPVTGHQHAGTTRTGIGHIGLHAREMLRVHHRRDVRVVHRHADERRDRRDDEEPCGGR